MLWILIVVVLFGSGYSFAHAFYLWRDRNKLGAFGIILVGLLISDFFLYGRFTINHSLS